MRVDLVATRRAALALSLSSLAALGRPPAPARAMVDGIPLYAPGDAILLPKAGFEYWLPRAEALRDGLDVLKHGGPIALGNVPLAIW